MDDTGLVVAPETVYLAVLGRNVEKGETIEVPADHAESLKAQGWKQGKKKDLTTETPDSTEQEK